MNANEQPRHHRVEQPIDADVAQSHANVVPLVGETSPSNRHPAIDHAVVVQLRRPRPRRSGPCVCTPTRAVSLGEQWRRVAIQELRSDIVQRWMGIDASEHGEAS